MDTMHVSDVMRQGVISISDEASLAEAIATLREHHISALVVVDHSGHMMGVISQTDLLRAWQDGATKPEVMERPVSEYMTRDVISCSPHKSLGYALRLLDQHKIHRLVVVETRDGGRFASDRMMPIGILSQTDIVRAMIDRFRDEQDDAS